MSGGGPAAGSMAAQVRITGRSAPESTTPNSRPDHCALRAASSLWRVAYEADGWNRAKIPMGNNLMAVVRKR